MSDKKISELVSLTGANAATGDLLPIVDISATETKKITREEFFTNIPNVGIGTSSPGGKLDVFSSAAANVALFRAGAGQNSFLSVIGNGNSFLSTSFDMIQDTLNQAQLVQRANAPMLFFTNNTERMRIDASGNLLVASTDADPAINGTAQAIALREDGRISARGADNFPAMTLSRGGTDGNVLSFYKVTTLVGSISVTTTATAFNTSSDYRLKEDVQPMVGASDRVLALNPVNFAWKVDGSRVDGFLAHEAQAVVPEAVTGEKDGEEMQAIDQSKLVPLLTAALQEALQKIDALEARITALEGTSA